jgi:hypothetical protein
MLCTSLVECLETLKPRQVTAISSPLGGLGVLTLARQVKLSVLTSGPIFNKIAALEAMDNYGAEVRYAPRLHTSIYKFMGEKECWVAGPPLVRTVAAGNSTSLSVYTCAKVEGVEKLLTSGKPLDALSSKVVGGGRDGRDFDLVVQLRSIQVKGEDEEEIADKIIRSGVFGVDDLDVISQQLSRLASRWRNRSAILFKDPSTGLGLTISMVYYGLKVIAGGQDCARGRCIKTTTKLLERALRLVPSSVVHERWRTALKEPQMRRRIEESPYIPAVFMLTGRVDVEREAEVKIYKLRQATS